MLILIVLRGGMIVSRVYLYHPTIDKAIFSLGTPCMPPAQVWLDFDAMVAEKPAFKYQESFGSTAFEDHFQSKEEIRQYFNATFGGRGPNGELGFSTTGALVQNWGILQAGTQLTKKVRNSLTLFQNSALRLAGIHEMDYYVNQYARNGLHGPRKSVPQAQVLLPWNLSIMETQSTGTGTAVRTLRMNSCTYHPVNLV